MKNFPRFLKSFQFHYKKIIGVRAALPFPPPPVSTSSFVLVSHLYAKVEGGRSVTRKRSGNLIGGPFADQASPCKILPWLFPHRSPFFSLSFPHPLLTSCESMNIEWVSTKYLKNTFSTQTSPGALRSTTSPVAPLNR